ncbi:MAG: hypothetical protein HOI80_05565 [Alphaproteobacteria bacterium]|jgi:hypothetical protein|nr:hypothetical protein [Alphaproteobacteria bacterium]MBT5390152.1 hypothetical protein [Alphaproteobacteria bacterium]MBT5540427.1 hypothetical protein [Alphaproteobacteria bacterium]MBT5654944.1 hypothetical protein [Alphaproteobacteria bacterium]
METRKEKFASQADPTLLATVRQLAKEEGRQLQGLLDEALRDYIAKREGKNPRKDVLKALAESVSEFDSLYKKLASDEKISNGT